MNLKRTKICLALALGLVNGFFAAAQSNGVPGPADYSAFTRFITDRNIFDPNRYAHDTTQRYRPRRETRSAPAFTLVGTMNYEKGMFAFFNGNNFDLRKVLYQSDSNNIAGFTMTGITLTGVTLQSADGKKTIQLKIGDVMRQEGSEWQLAGQGELGTGESSSGSETASISDNLGADSTNSAPPSALEQNDVLKKLMQQREQEENGN
jgi:hypothetical protein